MLVWPENKPIEGLYDEVIATARQHLPAKDRLGPGRCSVCGRVRAEPSPTCARWAEHDREGFDDWSAYEAALGPRFFAWATDIIRRANGRRDRYAAIQAEANHGLVWVLLSYGIERAKGPPHELRRSHGEFYDDADDHPEGAVAWASASAREHEDRRRESA